MDVVFDLLPVSSCYPPAENHAKAEIKHQLMCLHEKSRFLDGNDAGTQAVSDLIRHSSVVPGEHIGLTVSEASGQPVTQMNLNTFHLAGQITEVNVVERYKKRIAAVKVKNNDGVMTTIHFKDKNIDFDVLTLLSFFTTRIYLGNILVEQPEYNEQNKTVTFKIDKYRLYKHGISVQNVEASIKSYIASGGLVLHSSAIRKEEEEAFDETAFEKLIANASKILEDLDDEEEDDDEEDFVVLTVGGFTPQLYMSIVFNDAALMHVNNSCGIIESQASSITLDAAIKSVTKIGNRWYLWIDYRAIKTRGIPLDNVVDALEGSDFSKMDRVLGDIDSSCIVCEFDPYPVLRSKRYSYFVVKGGNYKDFIRMKGVDPYVTICDDPRAMRAVWGIEVACDWLKWEFYSIFASGGQNIAPRNIEAIPDFMCHTGEIVPMTSKGSILQRKGCLADMTFEDAISSIERSAVNSNFEKTVSVSALIMVGRQINVGTGAFKVEDDDDIIAKLIKNNSERTIAKRVSAPTPSFAAIVSAKMRLPGAAAAGTAGAAAAGISLTPQLITTKFGRKDGDYVPPHGPFFFYGTMFNLDDDEEEYDVG